MARVPGRATAHQDRFLAGVSHFFPQELAKLDTDCRGLLMFLEQTGILTLGKSGTGDRPRHGAQRGNHFPGEPEMDRSHGVVQPAERGNRLCPYGKPGVRSSAGLPSLKVPLAVPPRLAFNNPLANVTRANMSQTWSSSNRRPKPKPSRNTWARISRCWPPTAMCAIWCPRKARSIPSMISP